MMKCIALLLIITFQCSAQNVKIDTLKIYTSHRFESGHSNKINYPFVVTSNPKIDSLINFDIKNKLTGNEYSKERIDSSIIKWAEDIIVFLGFSVTYNQRGIISLNITTDGCGAYCTNRTEYFNYSTLTGKSLPIDSIVDMKSGFRKLILNNRNAQFAKNNKELKAMLLDKSARLDSSLYELTLEYYNECKKTFNLNRFALYSNRIEIIEDCYLPNSIKNLTPIIELVYYFKNIRSYLRIKN